MSHHVATGSLNLFLEYFLLLLAKLSLFELCENLKLSLLLAINLEVVAPTIETLKSYLRGDTPEDSVVDDCDSVAKHVGLLHRMGGDHDGNTVLKLRYNVPQLSSVLWIKAS